MKTIIEFPFSVAETPDLGIVLADGTRLSARVWKPEGQGPFPAILEFLPYRKRDGTVVRDALTHPYLAGHGYVCLRVDMRGNGDSDGLMADEYSPQELSDACEVINWIATQDWSNGRVGMMGISWGGFNSLQVAALQPEPLKAIITLCSTVDRYADDIHYKGGCLLNENLGWGATMWAYSSRPPDPGLRQGWHEMWMDRLKAEPFLPALWLRHQRRDDYWKHGSVCEDYSKIRAAVLAVGGWGDSYKNAVPQLVENIASPVKGIVGPWVHKYPHFAVPHPRIGFLQEALRWWDRWLKDEPTGVEDDPAYRVYLMDGVRPQRWYENRPGRWIAEPSWPSPNVETQTLPLGPGTLGQGGAFEIAVNSPQDCGMEGGEYCAIWLGPEMPGDQRRDDVLSACFDSVALDQTDIVGAPVLSLTLSSDKPLAQIAVRLNHVHPDGADTRVTWGVLNLTHRDSHAEPAALEPGKNYRITLPIDHIAYRLPKGHRLRVAVSTSYWPMLWPMAEAATLTLTEGALALPVRRVAADADEVTFQPAESAKPLTLREIRPDRHVRRTEIDQRTGIVSLIIEDDFGEYENADHGGIAGSVARERWDIHPDDPLSAHGSAHWTEVVEREGRRLRTEAFCSMRSDATHFHLSARIEAWEGDELTYARNHEESVARDFL
ncbi:MAG TPA: CocE/NonD family hydrolase [Paracoccaceae bacterium]|nr:CocE/NonD family hydrolase [Paracoccaceae bacterium]